MPTTIAELALSATYRQTQRALAAWLERDGATARRGVFAARALLVGLDAAERHRLVRWLAWLSVAARSHGESLHARIMRLDVTLCAAVEETLARLPVGMSQVPGREHRLSA